MAEPTRSRKPGPRSWARRCAAQALYEWQISGQQPTQIAAQFLADEDLNKADPDYFRELVHQVPARVAEMLAPVLTGNDLILVQGAGNIGKIARSLAEIKLKPQTPEEEQHD